MAASYVVIPKRPTTTTPPTESNIGITSKTTEAGGVSSTTRSYASGIVSRTACIRSEPSSSAGLEGGVPASNTSILAAEALPFSLSSNPVDWTRSSKRPSAVSS